MPCLSDRHGISASALRIRLPDEAGGHPAATGSGRELELSPQPLEEVGSRQPHQLKWALVPPGGDDLARLEVPAERPVQRQGGDRRGLVHAYGHLVVGGEDNRPREHHVRANRHDYERLCPGRDDRPSGAQGVGGRSRRGGDDHPVRIEGRQTLAADIDLEANDPVPRLALDKHLVESDQVRS